jgi:hypothetical protein
MNNVYKFIVCSLLVTSACASLDQSSPKGDDDFSVSGSALDWLQRQQNSDGHWGARTNQVGLTSLAVLAFLSHAEGPQSSNYGKTVINGLNALMRDVEIVVERTGDSDAVLTSCLAEAYRMTFNPNLLKALDVQTNRLDFLKATIWDVRVAKSLSYIDAYRTFGRHGLTVLCATYPNNPTNMFNQASRFLLGGYSGDSALRDASLLKLRNLDVAQWKADTNSITLSYLLTETSYHVGGKDWTMWSKVFFDDIRKRQLRKGKLGWWSPESLGVTSDEIKGYSALDKDIFLTSMLLMSIPDTRYYLWSYRCATPLRQEELVPIKPDPDDIVIIVPEL